MWVDGKCSGNVYHQAVAQQLGAYPCETNPFMGMGNTGPLSIILGRTTPGSPEVRDWNLILWSSTLSSKSPETLEGYSQRQS